MRVKAHQRYYICGSCSKGLTGSEPCECGGKRILVPGVTTITGVIDKSRHLVPWANRMGLNGIDTSKYRDEMADVGTCAHYLIECHLRGEEPDLADFTANQISMAENAALSYFEWESAHAVEPVFVEGRFASGVHRYGGTIDLYARVDGVPTLLDFKTSKGVYREHKIQVGGGYLLLLQEHGYPVERVLILHIGRTEDEGFDQIDITKKAPQLKRAFLAARELYDALKGI